jgi:NitT/TauT family transport system substrate-binding protein
MKRYGIVTSGEAEQLGIGCMTDAKQKGFYDDMVAAGVLPAGLDYADAFTSRFVCSGVGMELAAGG